MKFEKDESGRIAILPFYLYVMRTVSVANPYMHEGFSLPLWINLSSTQP